MRQMNELLPYIMDLAVIFIFVLYAARGWKKGLARTLVSMLSWLLAILIAWQLYGAAADLLRGMGVQAKLASGLGAGAGVPAQPGVTEASAYIEALFLSDALKASMIGNNNYEAYAALGVSSFADYVGVFLANIVVNAIAFLVIFLLSFILLRVVGRSLSFINHIPLIGLANQILGLAAGAVAGFCMIQIWMFVFTMLATGQNIFTTIVKGIENSTVAAWFYNGNHLVDWILKIFA